MQITVLGEAARRYQPEQAILTLKLNFESPDKTDVISRTTDLVRRFTAETDALCEGDTPVVAQRVVLPIGVRSWRPWSQDGEVREERHAASATVRLRFVDFAALSALIDRWGGEDGVQVGSVEWSLTEARLRTEEAVVLADAVAAARTRAEVLARAAGADGVEFVEIADAGLLGDKPEAQPTHPGLMRALAAPQDDAGIDLTPEEIELSRTIHARFAAR